jgi:hypothetical protein
MALSHRARRAWSLVILLVGLPLWVVLAVTGADWLRAQFGRPVWWLELALFVALGIVWALPFRAVFRGVGQADPDAPPPK